jgi:hypothetical protein
MTRRPALWAALLMALLSGASVAHASVYNLSSLGIARSTPRGSDYGYWGPRFTVTSWGTSLDEYVCPPGQQMSNWVVVAEDRTSERNWTDWASDYDNQFYVHVTYWGRWLNPPPLSLRVAASCTNNPVEFPYKDEGHYPPGDYPAYWDGVLQAGSPTAADYAELVKRAFCWSATYPRCALQTPAPTHAGRFAMHDGNDAIHFRFRDRSLKLPPAVRLAEPGGCRARHLQVTVEQRSGYLRLLLNCRALKRGSVARVRIAQPLRRNFRLHHGRGSLRVRLAKPLGSPDPLLYLAYGRRNTSCGNVRAGLRSRSRTFELRVTARCGRAAGNVEAHLYIGGLLR